ncbi:MAG: tetratricopeptide repeat protein [Propionibacteriaceae bacterium]|nr:tetratricopeptide repeat protein [Propionibacteriaceae bacterium]
MLGYALLAEDWSSADQICQLHSLDYYYLNICGVTAARGRVTDMSVAAADTLQDLMRQWNQLDLATAWNEAWVESSPDEPVAWERLGEVKFLQSDWIGAAEACAQANNLYNTYTSGPAERDQPNNRLENWSNGRLRNMSGPGWALLRQASAERQQDHWKSATALLDLVSQAQVPFDSQWPAGFEHFSQDDAQLLNMYVEMERGQLASDQADHQETIARMEASIALRDSFWQPVVTGAQEQAISLAYFKLGDYQAALDWAEQALAADPFSPLYQEAVADARRALGQATPSSADPTAEPAGVTTNPETTPDEADPGSDRSELIAAYRQSLDLDPSLFSSWNNLGVLLAQDGQAAAAAQAFQQAVRLLPDYAIAWFNLGALEADQPGLGAFLLSQGALGRAGALDSGWKNQDPELSFDNEVYASGLDVSKPIPADWQLAQTVRANTPVVTAGLVFVLLLRVGKELSQSLFTERLAQRSLKRGAHPRLSALTRLRRPAAITSLVSAAALLWVVGPNGWRETVLVGLGAVVLLGWHAFAPRLLAAGRDAGHQAFPLASLLTLGLAPFGLGFTPPAPLAADHAPAAVRRSGIAALTVLTLALAALAAVTAVPATRATALAGVLVLSSALIPFPPLDGGRLQTKRRTELAISLLLLVATIAVALKLI